MPGAWHGGRWLAYGSADTGNAEIYVMPYGRSGARQRVSVEGGWLPRWDGPERLFFRAEGESLMTVTLRPDGDRLAIGRPETVVAFEEADMDSYGLHPDGRILITRHPGSSNVGEARVVVGWQR